VAEPSEDGAVRRYALAPEDAEVVLDATSARFRAGTVGGLIRALRGVPGLVRAFREGGGLTEEDLEGADPRLAEQNRAAFTDSMAGWLAQVPELDARLRGEPPARVADVACGSGWSSMAMARAYPKVRVDGFDIDPHVIALASQHVVDEGLQERVGFQVRDAADPKLAGRYDLVTVFEALHDMAHPVAALRSLRSLLHEGGAVLVVDERTEDTFTAPGSELERSHYGWSLLSCLPWAMAEPGSAGTGTVMRPSTLRAYAEEAGFRGVGVLDIDDEFWRFYLLHP
jgi:SAM-dependent methyltransferase